MNMQLTIVVLLCLLRICTARDKVSYLEAGSVVDYEPSRDSYGLFRSDLRTYCYAGSKKSIPRLFETVELQFDIEGEDFTQYEGSTPDDVRQHFDEHRSFFSVSLFSQKRTRFHLSSYKQQCIGMDSKLAYRVRLYLISIDMWKILQLFAGVFLFTYARMLSQNAIFYYITGIIFGICSSFMLLVWFSSKFMPRRTMMYGILIGGWTFGFYFIKMLWDNLQLIVITYRTYVFWYILCTGIVSFLICYLWGPPKNNRSKNIIMWLLQFAALSLIYFCSQYQEVTFTFVFSMLVLYYFPRSILYKVRTWYLRHFPTKRRLLTVDEFDEEGVRETHKALEELRAYANSPNCKQWKIMSKLTDPMRFAAFAEGASHLRNEEILQYECSNHEDMNHVEYCTDDDEIAEEAENHRDNSMQFRSRTITHTTERESEIHENNMGDIIEQEPNCSIYIANRRTFNGTQGFHNNISDLHKSGSKNNIIRSWRSRVTPRQSLKIENYSEDESDD